MNPINALWLKKRDITSSEGRNRGNRGRIKKLIKIAVFYYRLHLALLEYTFNITSFENKISCLQFLIILCGMLEVLQLEIL